MVEESIVKIQSEIYDIWDIEDFDIDFLVKHCVKQDVLTDVKSGVGETIWFEVRDCICDQARRDLTW